MVLVGCWSAVRPALLVLPVKNCVQANGFGNIVLPCASPGHAALAAVQLSNSALMRNHPKRRVIRYDFSPFPHDTVVYVIHTKNKSMIIDKLGTGRNPIVIH